MSDRAGLSAARSLAAAGAAVDVIDLLGSSPAASSRSVRMPWGANALTDLCDARRVVETLLRSGRYDAALPMTDEAIVLLLPLLQDADIARRVALPPVDVLERARNKAKLLQLAASIGVPVPTTSVIDDVDTLLQTDFTQFRYPLVVKTAYSAVEFQDHAVRLAVRHAAGPDDAEDAVRDAIALSPVLMQERVPRFGYGVYGLASQGRIVSEVHQVRLHEPQGGGGGSLRATVAAHPAPSQYAGLLTEALHWTGPFMVELRTTGDDFRLMEVNTRFWGSLALTQSAGLDYAVWEVQRTITGEYPKAAADAEPVVGIRQRHLRNDVVWWSRNVRRGSSSVTPQEIPTNRRRAQLDVERLADPRPALESYVSTVRDGAAIVTKRMARGRVLGGLRARRSSHLTRAVAALSQREARVLFVCRGNICRSAFAAAWWDARHPDHSVRSAGTLPRPGRLVPRRFEEAAGAHDVDLAQHRSSILRPRDLEWADTVVVMDFANLADVDRLRRRLAVDVPLLLLGDVDRGEAIIDPFALPTEEIGAVLTQMVGLLETLDERAR